MAASIALPPFFKMSNPTCAASGWLVATIPWGAITTDLPARAGLLSCKGCSCAADSATEPGNRIKRQDKTTRARACVRFMRCLRGYPGVRTYFIFEQSPPESLRGGIGDSIAEPDADPPP